MNKQKCENCQHWERHSGLWGRCDIAKTGLFKHRKGYICRHTQARQHNQPACKIRFAMKEGD